MYIQVLRWHNTEKHVKKNRCVSINLARFYHEGCHTGFLYYTLVKNQVWFLFFLILTPRPPKRKGLCYHLCCVHKGQQIFLIYYLLPDTFPYMIFFPGISSLTIATTNVPTLLEHGKFREHLSLLKTIIQGNVERNRSKWKPRLQYTKQSIEDAVCQRYLEMKRNAEKKADWRPAANES